MPTDTFRKTLMMRTRSTNITAKKSADGSVAIQFGGCDGKMLNCLPIEPGWNYRCTSIVRAPKFSTASGPFRRPIP